MEITEVLEKAKEMLQPGPDELAPVDAFLKDLQGLMGKAGIDAACMTGGSVGKGTYIRGNFDVDIFVRFARKYESDSISDILGHAIAPLQPIRLHGSRDYFQVRRGLLFEIVPVLKVDRHQDAKNVTDMSPLHVAYTRRHIEKKPGLADEIRLAKQFCKSRGVYGAESYIQGFSGHVLDILVIHYGSFLNLLSGVRQWKEKKVIDIELHLDNPEKELNRAKQVSPLILVDPLQPNRNAAAALSPENYALFKGEVDHFLTHPSLDYFVVRDLTKDYLMERFTAWNKTEESEMAIISVVPVDDKDDIAGVKVKKAFEFLKKAVSREFTLIAAEWQFRQRESVFAFIVKKENLPEFEDRAGPPLSNKKYYQAFLTKHPDESIFVKNKRIHVLVRRKHRTFSPFLKWALQSPNVTARITKVKGIDFY